MIHLTYKQMFNFKKFIYLFFETQDLFQENSRNKQRIRAKAQ
jgi:hypothetical protein